ncbi:phage tail tape measure protein [Antrihabitans spumae]|uniref:Phage tail tape measure protein n=1 Tax=Antrihabitans spumae TaxID=3373370 RepID=A0ABW7KJR9_9NOCA
MALDVARLIARLEVDDSNLNRGLDTAEQRLRQLDAAAQRANQATRGIELQGNIAGDARQAEQAIGRVGDTAEQASRDVQRIATNADEASTAARRIEIPSGLAAAAQRASDAIGRIGSNAASASSSGSKLGDNFVSGFSDKLGDLASKSGPVAGSLIGIAVLGVAAGAALAGAIQQGMQQELDRDLFQARTGTTEAQARKFALAAGEAYSDAFGESVAQNLSTLKLALQNNIIDPAATQRDAEAVIASLDTISVALEGEVTESVNAVSALMSSGLATSAEEASDMIANAVGGSANKGQDLLEVINEYSAGWKNAGFSAEASLALIEQATDNGAWNADAPGDALREFGRRISEEGDTIVETLDGIGLNGAEMFERFKQGGPGAFDAFDEAFDKIRALEDPTARANAVMGLLGDTAGDFSDVFEQWDPSAALSSFGEFEGAAGRLAGIMGDNSATSVSGAMRSISTIADGLKGALAEAFGPKIQEFANMISNNRAGVIEFFITLGNGAFEAGKSILGFVASGLDAFASLTDAGTNMVVGILKGLAAMASGFDASSAILGVFGVEVPSVSEKIGNLARNLEEFGGSAANGMRAGADGIRNTVVPALGEAQERFNQFAGEMKLSAAFNDQAAKVNSAIGEIGMGIDGASIKIENWTGAIDRSNVQQVAMEDGLRGMVDQFREQTRTGLEAGNTVEILTAQYAANRDALIQQLMATGMGNQAAVDYLNSLGLIPNLVETQISQPGMPESHYALDVLKDKVVAIPDGKTIETTALTEDALDELVRLGLTVTQLPNGNIKVTAGTADAEAAMVEWINRRRSVTVDLALRRSYWQDQGVSPDLADQIQGPVPMVGQPRADGGITASYADGKLPDQAIVQPARGSRGLIQWAERETDGEAFIPFAASKRPRSLKIWAEAGKRLGALAMAEGGITSEDSARMGGGTINASLWQALKSNVPGAILTSAKTDHDDDGGYHPRGQAIDVDPSQANADYLWSIRSQLGQIITTIPDRIWYNVNGEGQTGQAAINTYTPSVVAQHDNHIHAMANAIVNAGAGTPNGGPDNRTTKQRNIDTVIAEGKRRGMSDKQIKTAVMALLAEAGGEDPGDAPGSEYDSEGGFQQRPSMGWGPAGEDLATDAGQFYERLAAVPGAEGMTEAQLAQAVQGSAHADGSNYAAQEAAATEAIAESSGRGTTSGPPSSATTTQSAGVGDGSRVFVTNWPTALGGGEKTPIATFSAKMFGSGGIEDHSAQISSGMRIWAEPETQGEAYIPLAQSKRQRSLAIWAETGKRLGVAGYADGGGFGGYSGPDTEDSMKPKNWYDALALGTGLAFTAASGLAGVASMAQSGTVDLGNIIPSFDTGSNDIPGASEAFQQATKVLEEILATLQKGGTIDANVTVDTNTGGVNAALLRSGIA